MSSTDSGNNRALALWQQKLEFLQAQEAIAADPSLKFSLEQQIKEAKDKIREIEADVLRTPLQPQLSPPIKKTRLTGPEIGTLRKAILDAFPDSDDLAVVLKTSLDIDYNMLKQGSSYGTIVFNIITNYFEPRNETENLVNALLQETPKNEALRNFYQAHYQ